MQVFILPLRVQYSPSTPPSHTLASTHTYTHLHCLLCCSQQKGEQKDYYANERNYIHWLHMGVTLGNVCDDHEKQIISCMWCL